MEKLTILLLGLLLNPDSAFKPPEDYHIIIETRVDNSCFIQFSYKTTGQTAFTHKQSTGVHVQPSEDFLSYSLTLPGDDISGLRIAFYGALHKRIELRKIKIEHGTDSLILSPSNIYSDVYWQATKSPVELNDESVIILAEPTEKGLGATNGFTRFSSERRLRELGEKKVHHNSIFVLSILPERPCFVKIFFNENEDNKEFYEYSVQFATPSKGFQEFKFEALTKSEISTFKIEFESGGENVVHLGELRFSSDKFARSWSPNQIKREFTFNPNISAADISEGALRLQLYERDKYSNPYIVLNSTRLRSRTAQALEFVSWILLFTFIASLLHLTNRFIVSENVARKADLR